MQPSKILRTAPGSSSAKRSAQLKKPTVKQAATKKRLPSAERRQQLIDVAQEVFLSVGREGVSTHQIAEAAGVNVALLYQHFSSSLELFDVAVLQPLEQLLADRAQAAAEALPPAGADPREVLAQLHVDLLTTLVEAAPMLSIALFGDQEAGREFYRDRIEPLLEDWIEATYRRIKGKHRAFDPASVARGVFGVHITLALDAHLLGVKLDIPSVARDVSDFMYLGLVEPGD